ncbi:MAG: D-Ala-D-Ala carboxypeptidase family metallohydrolase [Myxococcota bacterium]
MIEPPPIYVQQHVGLLFREFILRVIFAAQMLPVGFQVQPTSWFRDIAHNARVGGAVRSQHLLGLALDLVVQSSADVGVLDRALHSADLVVIREPDHVHVQLLQAGILPGSLFRDL